MIIIATIMILLVTVWKAFFLFTGDWWQFRYDRRLEFRQVTDGLPAYEKLLNWIGDFWNAL
jgi:hypothetical protein